MSKINITRTKNSVSATAHLPYAAYKHACELATASKGTIGRTTNGFFKADFDTVETADKFVRTWRADYAEAHAAYTPKEKTDKKADKKTKPSSTKKGKGKDNSFDFDSVKGNTKKEKNKALHAMLVGMGIGDSRTEAYQAVWTARPWAK